MQNSKFQIFKIISFKMVLIIRGKLSGSARVGCRLSTGGGHGRGPFRSMLVGVGIWNVAFAVLAMAAHAQLATPTIRRVRPIGSAPGEAIALTIQGSDLDGASALLFDDP